MGTEKRKHQKLKTRRKKTPLYRAITKQFGSVAALCRGYKHWLRPSSMYEVLSFKRSPRDQQGKFREICHRLSDILGIEPEELFPRRVYETIQHSPRMLEVTSFAALPSDVAREVNAVPAPSQEEENVLEGQEELENLAVALSTLPASQRQALEMRFGLGEQNKTHTFEEIGVIQKISYAAARQRCLAAINKLHKLLVEKKVVVPYPRRLRTTCGMGHHTMVGLRPRFTRWEASFLESIRRRMPSPLLYGHGTTFSPELARMLLSQTEIGTRIAGFTVELKAVALRYGLDCHITHSFVEMGKELGCDYVKSYLLVREGLSRLMGTLVLSPLGPQSCVICQQRARDEMTLLKSEESFICSICCALGARERYSPDQIPDIMLSAIQKVMSVRVVKVGCELLTPRQLEALVLRFGLNCGRFHHYENVASVLEISGEVYAVQLVHDALKAMLRILE